MEAHKGKAILCAGCDDVGLRECSSLSIICNFTLIQMEMTIIIIIALCSVHTQCVPMMDAENSRRRHRAATTVKLHITGLFEAD